MHEVGGEPVGRYLLELIRLVARATPGLLHIDQGTDRRYRLTGARGQTVAVVNRRADAEVFARDRMDLRALVLGVSEVIGRHRDRGDGRCCEDGQLLPCGTLHELLTHLAQRAGSASEEPA
jgi:hypothetical protein